MEFNLEKCLLSLAEKRPVFHSEADFQFSLAWEIQQQYQKAEIRLEYPFEFIDNDRKKKKRRNNHIDIMVYYKNNVIPIELKYKTKKVCIDWNGEKYNLTNQLASTQVRYAYLYDIQRIEEFSKLDKSNKYIKGYTVWLTNDKSYWKNECKDNFCEQFSVHNGAIKQGKMNWCGTPKSGTTEGKEKAINLTGEYKIEWKTYKNLEDGCTKNCEFRYVILEIKKSE